MTFTTGNSTVRRYRVYRSQAVHSLIRCSDREIRRRPRRCASTVRPASTVSVSADATAAYPAASERYAEGARRKYQRQPITRIGSASSAASASGGAVTASAP